MCKNVNVKKEEILIPTYVLKPAMDLPMFFEKKPYQGASGRVYPLPFSDSISDEKSNKAYEVFTLENEYIKTQILPAMGGKILRGYDKAGNYDFIYYNEVVKPALVGLAGPWISGGIEFNWPQHHRPTTCLPLETAVEELADGGKIVWTGEVDPFYRMKGMVGVTVEKNRSFIKAKIRVYNRTNEAQVFMWWANLAVPVNDTYRAIFPPDVEWVNDHDRRAVLEWPIAKGIYYTARPFDYGDGTDISKYSAVKVPSSFLVSQGQSDMDFVAGYDEGKQKGIVTVADHHISPGKKMWHWGKGDFGDMWCNNLTDKNGPYIELMTGIYTDNQPDFTWIAPYETREFEQYWYPIRDIGSVVNATIDAAMNMEQRDDNLFFGFNVTGVFERSKILVKYNNEIIFTETADLEPTKAYLKTMKLNGLDFYHITVSLISKDENVLVEYTPYIRGQKQPIEVRKPVKRPLEIETVEELYINGLHLEQYKQHNYDPRDYYLEGVKRDKEDIRCNTGLARLSLKTGEFSKCIEYCDAAIKRLTSRNQHPVDTESMYLKGLALKYIGKYEEAYNALFVAGWNYTHRSAAYYELAAIDCRNERLKDALEKLQISVGLNYGHLRAHNLKAAVLRHLHNINEAESLAQKTSDFDRLDLWSMIELSFTKDLKDSIKTMFGKKPEDFIDVVCDYIHAGFYEDALFVLNIVSDEYPLYFYYRAYCYEKLGKVKKAAEEVEKGEKLDTGYCFPSRLEDIAVLENSIQIKADCDNAYYYLGCLYYDRLRYEDAISCWENCVDNNKTHKKAYRNLALAYFDKRKDFSSAKACLEKALLYKSDDPRVLFEYQQLLKNTNVEPEKRLEIYEQYQDLMLMRDDCYLDKITLKCMLGEYKEAIDLASVRRFHIYEGGEGKLTKQHAWMHVLYGNELRRSNTDAAEQVYLNGLNMPKSYGEAKTFFNQEAHIYYYLGQLFEHQNRAADAEAAYKEASQYKAAISEISLFRALALKKLGDYTKAKAVLDEMIQCAEELIVNCDLYSYYGVGSPSPMPFEYDIKKENLTNGYVLKAYALLGLGQLSEAETIMDNIKKISPYDFRVYVYEKIHFTIDAN